MSNKYLCVVDLETAAPWNDAIIFSMGMTLGEYSVNGDDWDTLKKNGLFVKFDAVDQKQKYGRTTHAETMDWWKKQDAKPRSTSVLPNPQLDVKLDTLPEIFETFFKDKGVKFKDCDIWDRRSFDMSKLQHAWQINLRMMGTPWNYMNELEVSTFLKFQGFDRYGDMPMDMFPQATYHDPLDDAIVDHIRIITALKKNELLT